MPVNRVAENVLGTIGTVCWTVQLLPQLWKTWRTKSSDGLSEYLVLLWAISCPFFGVYTIIQNLNIPLIIQPHLLGFLCLISWAQCQYYQKKRSRRTVTALFVGAFLLLAGFEVGMIFAVRPSFEQGNEGPLLFFGIASSVLIAVALLPQYYEIYKHREVIGISLLFMAVDVLGGIFSDLSLAFKETFDVTASITYTLVVVMDAIILLLAVILNPIARRRRMREAERPDTDLPEMTTTAPSSNGVVSSQ